MALLYSKLLASQRSIKLKLTVGLNRGQKKNLLKTLVADRLIKGRLRTEKIVLKALLETKL